MKIAVYLSLFAIACTEVIKEKKQCDGIQVNGELHRKVILAKGLNRPYHLSCFRENEVIFFSYNIGGQNEDAFQVAFIDREHKYPTVIYSIVNGFATAVSNEKEEAYLGGSEGIHLYPLNVFPLVHSKINHDLVPKYDIWYLFHKHDTLYFITYPKMRLYKRFVKENEVFIVEEDKITEKIHQFLIDDEGDTFITNKTGLFRIKKDSQHRIRISGNYTEFRAATLDVKGRAYFAGGNSIYTVNKTENELQVVAKIDHVFGITFDFDNNIIYSNPHQIVKLLPGC